MALQFVRRTQIHEDAFVDKNRLDGSIAEYYACGE
jgi:hypothetical protein